MELIPGDPALKEKVKAGVMGGVGRSLVGAEDCRYAARAVWGRAPFFVAHDVPQRAPPFPPGVSDVRFVADLTHAAPAPEEMLRGNRLWASLSRRPDREW